MIRDDPSPILFYFYFFIRSELVRVDPSWSDPDWRSELIRSDFCTCLGFCVEFCHVLRGIWKSRKPESGIGTGMGTGTGTGTGNGNGTGTVMWRGTDTRTGTSFTLNYFNSNSIYTKTKKTSLVSCSPPPPRISLYYGNEKVEKAVSNSFASASRFLSIFSPPMHNYDVNDQILS